MKTKVLFILVLTTLIFLNSCTVQQKTDIYGFIRRVNKTKELSIDDSSYYYDGEHEYSYLVNADADEFMLCLATDSEGSVESIRLTALKPDGTALSSQTAEDYYRKYILFCSVLTGASRDTVQSLFSENGFTADNLLSDSCTVSIEAEKNEYFINVNTRIISMYCSVSR